MKVEGTWVQLKMLHLIVLDIARDGCGLLFHKCNEPVVRLIAMVAISISETTSGWKTCKGIADTLVRWGLLVIVDTNIFDRV